MIESLIIFEVLRKKGNFSLVSFFFLFDFDAFHVKIKNESLHQMD